VAKRRRSALNDRAQMLAAVAPLVAAVAMSIRSMKGW